MWALGGRAAFCERAASCAQANPELASELALLRHYGAGKVEEALLGRLCAAFSELRGLADEGMLSYPYSTRELVNVVKHMVREPPTPSRAEPRTSAPLRA